MQKGILAISPINFLLEEMIWDRPDSVATIMRNAVDPNMGLDFHAGFFETSLVLHFAPETVGDYHVLPPCPQYRPNFLLLLVSKVCFSVNLTRVAKQFEFAAIAVQWQQLRPHPGYSGRPDLASKENGKLIAQEILEQYSRCVSDYFVTHNPKCLNSVPLGWLYFFSLGGKLI